MITKFFAVKIALAIVLILYFVSLLIIFLYSIAQAQLLFWYLKSKKNKQELTCETTLNVIPYVTVQLPVFNELYVVERLIDSVCSLNYPVAKLEIQVLDDSTDETRCIISTKVETWKQRGIDVIHIHRENRTGYKAGALKEGLEKAKGEFIAIFDSDFLPDKDFLLKTLPHFTEQNVGMVQTRWEHLNAKQSLLTRVQAFLLDAHFSIEQSGRNAAGYFMNFNGTAGIWRKSCIIDAGNWQPDTLTEDIDLSYRAQLKNWKFVYREDIGSPSELPPVMSAFKSQQYRWTKGGAETAKKLSGLLWKSDKPLKVKLHGFVHLFNSAAFICIVLCAFFSVPLMILKPFYSEVQFVLKIQVAIFGSSIIVAALYWVSGKNRHPDFQGNTFYFIKTFPVFLSVMMGLSLHNAIAVAEGYLGKKTPFIRTPKFNAIGLSNLAYNQYIKSGINALTLAEGILCFYFLGAIYLAFHLNDYTFLPFHIMLFCGFGFVFYNTVSSRNDALLKG